MYLHSQWELSVLRAASWFQTAYLRFALALNTISLPLLPALLILAFLSLSHHPPLVLPLFFLAHYRPL